LKVIKATKWQGQALSAKAKAKA